jgi:hypothetical protein
VCLHLQTVGSPGHPAHAAKDITAAEFNDIFKALIAELQDRKAEAGLRRSEGFLICLDHATVHKDAASLLPPRWQLLPHPAHSPECNKPVEHVHGIIDAHMKHWLVQFRQQQPGANPTPAQCKTQLTNFFHAIPTASIAADVSTLPDTWGEIVKQGGDHIADQFS